MEKHKQESVNADSAFTRELWEKERISCILQLSHVHSEILKALQMKRSVLSVFSPEEMFLQSLQRRALTFFQLKFASQLLRSSCSSDRD